MTEPEYQYVFIEAYTMTLHLSEIEIFDTAENKISEMEIGISMVVQVK